jgi:hypothetical protein
MRLQRIWGASHGQGHCRLGRRFDRLIDPGRHHCRRKAGATIRSGRRGASSYPMLLILLVMPSNKGPRLRRPSIDEIEEQGGH